MKKNVIPALVYLDIGDGSKYVGKLKTEPMQLLDISHINLYSPLECTPHGDNSVL
jgi:hypothetical protein